MATLKIHLFGHLRLYQGERLLSELPNSKVSQLFGYLVLNRRQRHPRHLLATLFWSESLDEPARRSLRTSLWRLRQLLEPDGRRTGGYLLIENGDVGFNAQSDYWLDIEAFEHDLSSLGQLEAAGEAAGQLDQARLDRLERAVALYHGDLLVDCAEDWCLVERQRLQDLYLRALAALMTQHRLRGAHQEALRWGHQILAHDPVFEDVHREMMRLYWLTGNRTAALRQYRLCQQRLARELEIEPAPETTALYQAIARQDQPRAPDQQRPRGAPIAGWSPAAAPSPRRLQDDARLSEQLDRMLSECRQLQVEAHQLSAHIERIVGSLECLRLGAEAADAADA